MELVLVSCGQHNVCTFAQCAEEYSMQSGRDWSKSTSMLGTIFAFCFLTEEAALDLLSTVLIEFVNVPWTYIFAVYASIAILSTFAMTLVQDYGPSSSTDTTTLTMQLLFGTN